MALMGCDTDGGKLDRARRGGYAKRTDRRGSSGSLIPEEPQAQAASPADVGRRVGDARTRRALTGGDLGALVGLSKDQISKIENGQRKISVRELPKFAEALGVTVAHLLGQPPRPTLAMAHRLTGDTGPDENSNTECRALQLLEVKDILA